RVYGTLRKVPILSCGSVSFLASWVLSLYNYSSRIVAVYTNHIRDGYDDGHTLVEILSDGSFTEKGRWILYDPSFNCLFYSLKTGRFISLIEAVRAVGEGELQIYKLPGNPGSHIWLYGPNDNNNFDFWVAHRILSVDELLNWYYRVIRIPAIYKDGLFYFNKKYAIDSKSLPKYLKGIDDIDFLNSFYNY
ncbi:MAG: hypothetical protein ABIL13_07555, partial [candidate division WOR-3 bacterium]